MEGDSAARSFIRFMMPGFTEELDVPRGFCKNATEGEKWTLKSRIRKWKVKVGRNEKGGICLKDGWTQFVSEHHLSIGDLVQFEQSGSNFRFNVTIFDSSACEKEFSTHGESLRKKKGASNDHNNTPPRFVIKMTPYHARPSARVFIPTAFLSDSKIGKKYTSLTLRDPLGREWSVNLVVSPTAFRVEMYTGWNGFYVSNELKLGDECRFELINCPSPRSTTPLLGVQIFRKSVENES